MTYADICPLPKLYPHAHQENCPLAVLCCCQLRHSRQFFSVWAWFGWRVRLDCLRRSTTQGYGYRDFWCEWMDFGCPKTQPPQLASQLLQALSICAGLQRPFSATQAVSGAGQLSAAATGSQLSLKPLLLCPPHELPDNPRGNEHAGGT